MAKGGGGGGGGGGSVWGQPVFNTPINKEVFRTGDKITSLIGGIYDKSKNAFGGPSESDKMRDQTEQIANQQREMAERAANEKAAKDKELQDELLREQEGKEAKTAKARQAKLAMGATGRRDTLLTGPLGLTASGPKSGKTLLGA